MVGLGRKARGAVGAQSSVMSRRCVRAELELQVGAARRRLSRLAGRCPALQRIGGSAPGPTEDWRVGARPYCRG